MYGKVGSSKINSQKVRTYIIKDEIAEHFNESRYRENFAGFSSKKRRSYMKLLNFKLFSYRKSLIIL